MRKVVGLMACAVVLLAGTSRAQVPVPGDSRPADRDAIRAHIDAIFQGFIQQDAARIRATHAPDWQGFLILSRSTLRGIDDYMKNATAGWSGPRRMQSYEMLEFEVLFYGDNVAIVPYIAEVTYAFKGRERTAKGKLRVLDVYAKLNDEWVQVASNTTAHPDTLQQLRRFPTPVTPVLRRQILQSRERVWRAYFAYDQAELERLIPDEAIAIDAGGGDWQHREEIFAGSKAFADEGGKLLRLEFRNTEIQLYQDIAVLYTLYDLDFEKGGEVQHLAGRGTEIFVRRGSGWVNSGWHLDLGQ